MHIGRERTSHESSVITDAHELEAEGVLEALFAEKKEPGILPLKKPVFDKATGKYRPCYVVYVPSVSVSAGDIPRRLTDNPTDLRRELVGPDGVVKGELQSYVLTPTQGQRVMARLQVLANAA